jgi:TolA-binding protein
MHYAIEITAGLVVVSALAAAGTVAVLPKLKSPEAVTQAEKADARQQPVPKPPPKLPLVPETPLDIQRTRQQIQSLEKRIDHIDVQVQRIEQKLEALDERDGEP